MRLGPFEKTQKQQKNSNNNNKNLQFPSSNPKSNMSIVRNFLQISAT